MPVSHGACVAIGTLTILALYDWLLTKETISIDISRLVANRPTLQDEISTIHGWFGGSHRGSVDRGNKGQIPVRCRSDNAARDAGLTGRVFARNCETILFRLHGCNGCWTPLAWPADLLISAVASASSRHSAVSALYSPTLHASRSACRDGYAGHGGRGDFSGEALCHHPDTARANSRQERQ